MPVLIPFQKALFPKSGVFFAPVGRKTLIKLSPPNGNIAFQKRSADKNYFESLQQRYKTPAIKAIARIKNRILTNFGTSRSNPSSSAFKPKKTVKTSAMISMRMSITFAPAAVLSLFYPLAAFTITLNARINQTMKIQQSLLNTFSLVIKCSAQLADICFNRSLRSFSIVSHVGFAILIPRGFISGHSCLNFAKSSAESFCSKKRLSRINTIAKYAKTIVPAENSRSQAPADNFP